MKWSLPIDEFLQREHQLSARFCDHPRCEQEGLYPAPKNREQLRDFYWFCLEHVREYNAKWNYYTGMSEQEIVDNQIHASKWERPTWPLGQKIKQRLSIDYHTDPFDLFFASEASKTPFMNNYFAPNSPERKALKILGLSLPFTEADLKQRYKTLAKQYHPDANQTDPHATEKFKKINDAYGTLKKAISKRNQELKR
jgi:hypothetical protein